MTFNEGRGVPLNPTAVPAFPPTALGGVGAYLASVVAPPFALTPRQTLLVAGTALLLGLWMEVLFQGTGWGINVPLWLGAAVAAVVYCGCQLGRPVSADRLMLLGGAVLLSSVFAWRDSVALHVLGLLGAVALVFLGVGLPSGTPAPRVSPVSSLLALAGGLVSLGTSAWRVTDRLPWGELPGLRGRTQARPVARAVLIAAPLLLVFGSLFVAADAVFAAKVDNFFAFDLSAVWRHLGRTLLGLWLGLALLWGTVGIVAPKDVAVVMPERYLLRRIEMVIVLGSLATLFALFVVVQIRYLFGGEDAVRSSVTLTYAEYARRGFFELIVASLLLLPVLAGVNWARERSVDSRRLFLLLAGILGVLLLVIMASAWQRLGMYREAFGLTELRFYAAATMPWLILTLLSFFAAVAMSRIGEFLSLAILYAGITLVALYLVNPDAMIVRTNAARIAEGKPFDATYAASLSADAVPELISRLAAIPADERCSVYTALKMHHDVPGDARSWNFSRAQASRLVGQHLGHLECG